jgi:predicted RNA-binding protein YlxR (DUF448 family)
VSVDPASPGRRECGAARTARAPGRGAYLCADRRCLERAEGRRALGRALRHEGALPAALWEELHERIATLSVTESGRRQEETHG